MDKEQLVSTVTAAQNGDNDALNTLFNEYYNDLYYFALKTVKDEETALDVTQEAFVEIINTLSNLKEPAAFVTWAKQITYHQCTRYFKKKKDVLVSEDEDGNTVFDTLQEENTEFIPDEALDQSDFKKTVMAILDELSEEQRSATMMYYFDEMSVKQIAEIQGVSEGTVKSRLNYARKAIKNSVEEYEKKNGIKLHAIPFFPFFKWLFEGSFEGGMPLASAELVAEGVCAATGTTVTVATATTTATAVATTTAVGIGAKIAAMPLVTKIIACVVAGVIAIGGGTTAIILSQNDKSEPADNQSVVSSEDVSSNDDSNTSSAEDTTTSSDDSSSNSSSTDNNSSTENGTVTDTSSETSSTEGTVTTVDVKITEDCYYFGLTAPYSYNRWSLPINFYPNGSTIQGADGSDLIVTTPIAYLGYSVNYPMVPYDVSLSTDYQHYKDATMQRIQDGLIPNIPNTATWDELFDNPDYFAEMYGFSIDGVKHITYDPAMGASGTYYDYTMSNDGSITLTPNSNYMTNDCKYTLSNIKVSEDKKTLTATVNHSAGFIEKITIDLK